MEMANYYQRIDDGRYCVFFLMPYFVLVAVSFMKFILPKSQVRFDTQFN